MKIFERIESIFINRIDRNNGSYRYRIGKRFIGFLEQYSKTLNIYYLMAPAFGNVGDEAIVEASVLFLNDMFPEFKVIVIDYLDTLQSLKEIRRILKKGDLIFLQGGGNIGTLYYDAECMREFIIRKFPDVPIVSMPQSMYFDDSTNGVKKLKKCSNIFNAHPNLTLIARERYTHENMRRVFSKCKVLLNPDIVFYYSKIANYNINYHREGVMTCLRTDSEDILGDSRIEIIKTLASKYDGLIISDTCVARNIPDQMRCFEVKSLINQFSKVKVVITDRLHGMVLAALTNTPCIVMPSLDKKVIGTHEWIQDADFIRFIDKSECTTIVSIIDEMISNTYKPYDWVAFREKHFGTLRERIGW